MGSTSVWACTHVSLCVCTCEYDCVNVCVQVCMHGYGRPGERGSVGMERPNTAGTEQNSKGSVYMAWSEHFLCLTFTGGPRHMPYDRKHLAQWVEMVAVGGRKGLE